MTLKPREGLHFLEEPHRYYLDGFGYLAYSVTEVISDLTPHAKAKIEATKDVWLPRGLTCHAALEAALLGLPGPDPGEYASIIDPLLNHDLWKGAEVLACEYRMADTKKSVGGSADFILRTAKGKLCVGDLKTVGSRPAVTSRKPATKQLGAYTQMLIDMHPHLLIDRCITVVAGPGLTRVHAEDPSTCISAWLDAWDVFNLLQPDF